MTQPWSPPGFGQPQQPAHQQNFAPQSQPQAPAPQPGFGQPPAPPGGYAGPQGGGSFGAPAVSFAGLGNAPVTPNTPIIPEGQHELECSSVECAQTSSGLYFFVHFKVLNSNNPNLIGTEVAFKQNMHPATRGGDQIAMSAIKAMVLPLIGVRLDDGPTVNSASPHLDGLLNDAVAQKGGALLGRRVYCNATPGKPGPNTKPGQTPFPRYAFFPVQ